MLILNFMLHLAVADAAAPCVPLNGGPADGMCPGAVIGRQGELELVELLPAGRAGPAIPPQVASTLSTLLRSQRDGTPIDQHILASEATSEFCATFYVDCRRSTLLRTWPFSDAFVSNPPYLLADGRIRIEWMWENKLEYLSFITFEGAKVKDIATAPAQVPRTVAR